MITGLRMFLVPTSVAIGVTGYIFNNKFNPFESFFIIVLFASVIYLLFALGNKKVKIEEILSTIENKIKKLESETKIGY